MDWQETSFWNRTAENKWGTDLSFENDIRTDIEQGDDSDTDLESPFPNTLRNKLTNISDIDFTRH